MADTTALKNRIRAAIKANDNQEITGPVLQQALLDIVDELNGATETEATARQNADSQLQTNINNEATARQNADSQLQTNINNEATSRQNADSQLQTNINNEATTRNNADTQLNNLITSIKNNIDNGYVYAGIATPSSMPVSGKVFYLAVTAGTYINFDELVVTRGINLLKHNGSVWSQEQLIGIDDMPTAYSKNLAESGGVNINSMNRAMPLPNIATELAMDMDVESIDLSDTINDSAWVNSDGTVGTISLSGWKAIRDYVDCKDCIKVLFRCLASNGQTILIFTRDDNTVVGTIRGDVNKDWLEFDIVPSATRMYVNIPTQNDNVANSLLIVKSAGVKNLNETKGIANANFFKSSAKHTLMEVVNSVPFPLLSNGSLNGFWYTAYSSLKSDYSVSWLRICEAIDYTEGEIYLHQQIRTNDAILVFADDEGAPISTFRPSQNLSEVYITPPSGTKKIYWNVRLEDDPNIDDVYMIVYHSISLSERISEGGKIMLEGTFEISSTVQIPSDTTIIGCNGKTIIRCIGNTAALEITGDTQNVVLKDLIIEGKNSIGYRIVTPSKTELEDEIHISEIPFSVYKDNKAYVYSGGVITELDLNGWAIMTPIQYSGGDVLIKGQEATSGQRILYACDANGNVLKTFTGNGTPTIYCTDIPSGTTALYWSCPMPLINTATMYKKGDESQGNAIGLYIHDGSKDVTVDNCIFRNFNFAGVKCYHTLTGGYRDAPKFNLCRFHYNINGLILAERAEFITLVNCEFATNNIGVWTCGANSTLGNCQISRNFSDGIVFVGGYQNGIHTVISNCEIVHNGYNAGNVGELHGTYDIMFINAVAGISITGCLVGIDGVLVSNSSGVLMTSCQFICPIFIETPRGCNSIHDNIWRKHSGLGVVINGDSSHLSLDGNRFSDGSDYTSINNSN